MAILAAIYGIRFAFPNLLGEKSAWGPMLYLLFPLPFLFFGLIPIAIAGAWRYRSSRSSWRNIRFSFRGHTREFMKLHAPGLLLTMFILGSYGPIFSCKIRKFQLDRTWFGNASFSFDGDGKELLGPYAVAFFLGLPTLGLSWFRYAARRHRYLWSHTRLGRADFGCSITGGSLYWLMFVNNSTICNRKSFLQKL